MTLRFIICCLACFSMLSCSPGGESKINGDQIQSSVKSGEDVYYANDVITGDVNLIDVETSPETSPVQHMIYIKSALIFKNCTFKGSFSAGWKDKSGNTYYTTFYKNLYFDHCTFEGDVNLEGAVIDGFCNFLSCTFNKDALFNRSTFNQTTAFSKCTFNQTGGFQGCTFANNVFFNDAHFLQACFFQNSFFYREFTFNVVTCDGYADFSTTSFYSNIYCNYAKFNKELAITGGNFKGRTEFVGCKIKSAEFDGGLFYGTTIFEKSDFTESLSLKDCKFLSGKPRTVGYKAGKVDINGVEVTGLGKLNGL